MHAMCKALYRKTLGVCMVKHVSIDILGYSCMRLECYVTYNSLIMNLRICIKLTPLDCSLRVLSCDTHSSTISRVLLVSVLLMNNEKRWLEIN